MGRKKLAKLLAYHKGLVDEKGLSPNFDPEVLFMMQSRTEPQVSFWLSMEITLYALATWYWHLKACFVTF